MALGYVPRIQKGQRSGRYAISKSGGKFKTGVFQRIQYQVICSPAPMWTAPCFVNIWLSHFVAETRNGKGEEYSPASLNQILAELLRHMRNCNPDTPNFVDKKNTHFKGLHGTLDNLHRKLHEKGKGTKVKHAEVITKGQRGPAVGQWRVGNH